MMPLANYTKSNQKSLDMRNCTPMTDSKF